MEAALRIPLDRRVLVSDFDGTMTRRDFYELVQERLPSQATCDWWGEYQAGRLSHFEVLRQIFGKFEGVPPEAGRLYLRIMPGPWNNESTGTYDVKVSVGGGGGQ